MASTPQTIIAGYDGGERGRDAIALAALLAGETGARVLVASGAEPAALEPALDLLDGVDAEVRAIGDRSPARALYGLAESSDADLVVIGSSRGATAGRTMVGSVGDRLLHGSACPVAVAPAGLAAAEPDLRVVAAAFDDTAESRAALALAAEIAVAAEATIRVIGVIDRHAVPQTGGALAADATRRALGDLRDAVHEGAGRLPSELRALAIVAEGGAAAELIDRCEQGVDLLVMGSRGYGPLRRVLLGSVSAMVLRAAPCPVIVVPRSAEGSAHDAG